MFISGDVLLNVLSIIATLIAIPVFGIYLFTFSASLPIKHLRALLTFWLGGIVGVLVDIDHIWVVVQKGHKWYDILAWVLTGGRPWHITAFFLSIGLFWCGIACAGGLLAVITLYKNKKM